jgi:Ala-tRNA(Pro) deacylase
MAKTLQRLDKANCDYDIIPHPHSATSLESARTAGVPAERVAKSVMLDDRHGNYIMAVLPANRHLDMTKVRMSGAWQLTRESGCRCCSVTASAAPCRPLAMPTR